MRRRFGTTSMPESIGECLPVIFGFTRIFPVSAQIPRPWCCRLISSAMVSRSADGLRERSWRRRCWPRCDAGRAHGLPAGGLGAGPHRSRVRRKPTRCLRLLGRVAGIQFASQAERRSARARARFETFLTQTTKAPELAVMHVLRDRGRSSCDASSGSVTLTRRGQTRRIAAIGPPSTDVACRGQRPIALVADHFVCAVAVGADEPAVLELHAAPGAEFTRTPRDGGAGLCRTPADMDRRLALVV